MDSLLEDKTVTTTVAEHPKDETVIATSTDHLKDETVIAKATADPNKTISHCFKVGEEACAISTVCVYSDRAEVARKVQVELTPGFHEITVDGLPATIIADTIRISGGKGAVIIHEVSFSDRLVNDPPDAQAGAVLLEKKNKVQMEILEVEQNRKLLDGSLDWLDNFSDKVCDQLTAQTHGNSLLTGGHSCMDGARDFLMFKLEEGKRIQNEIRQINEKTKQLNKELSDLTFALNERCCPGSRSVRQVTIQIEVEPGNDLVQAQLYLTYVCYHASWSARYDSRIDSNNLSMQLTYNGVVTNSTGEDWKDVKISLSTAEPSIAGCPPQLPTSHITRKAPQPIPMNGIPGLPSPSGQHYAAQLRSTNDYATRVSSSPMLLSTLPSLTQEDVVDREERLSHTANNGLEHGPTLAGSSASATQTSCTFSIHKSANILSDNEPHKVTITIVDLNPTFTYVAVPKLNTNAYLKATVVNDSNFHLICGPMNVFMDSNYIATSHMENVSPLEDFNLFLGTDSGVKVTYAPQQPVQEQLGLVTKVNSVKYHRKTVVKNTKGCDITMVIYDQIPVSRDTRFKVTLREPEMKRKDLLVPGLEWNAVTKEGVEMHLKLNSQNNLEIKTKIAASQEISIPVMFTVETPIDVEIELLDL